MTYVKGVPLPSDISARRRWQEAQDAAEVKAGPAITILIPGPADRARGRRMVDAAPHQIPAGAKKLAGAAAASGRSYRITYALAEVDGALVHTCAVRIAKLGYATWRNGAFDGANFGGRLYGEADALAILLTGYPAPRVRCGRCGTEGLRVKADGSAWGHKANGAPCVPAPAPTLVAAGVGV